MKLHTIMHHAKEHSTTILFLAGFVFDMILLPDAGHALTLYIGFVYLGIVAISILFREMLVARNRATKLEEKIYNIFTFAIAYFSGSALSFVCVYAFRSADIQASWPLFVILLLCILVNETISAHNFRLTLDVTVLFIATLFFTVFNMPLIVGVQNNVVFLVSIGVTIVISLIFIMLLKKTSETADMESGRAVALAVGVPMFVGMLYFLNAIPAVPLALHTAGVFHRVEKNDQGEFIALIEEEESSSFFKNPFARKTHYVSPQDDGIYFYGAVDAPAEITAPLSHVWEKYNNTTKHWEEKLVIPFSIEGGRENGYRAYSKKESIEEGLWRVTIKVDTNRVVGRKTFNVVYSKNTIFLQEVKL